MAFSARFFLLTLFGWYVFQETGSAWFVGFVGLCWTTPLIPLGMVGGIIADSSLRKKTLCVTQSVGLVCVFAMTLLAITGHLEFWHTFPLILTFGICDSLDMPSRRTIAHNLLGNDLITNGISLEIFGIAIALTIGPILAGSVVGLYGIPVAGYVLIIMMSVSLLLVSKLPAGNGPSTQPINSNFIENIIGGVHYTFTKPILAGLVLITIIVNIFLFPHYNLMPVFATEILETGPIGLGFLQGAAGLGSVIGSLLLASRSNLSYHGRVLIIGAMIGLISLLIFSLSSTYILCIVFIFILGLGISFFAATQPLLAILISRHEMRGKALGVVNLAIGSGPIGVLLLSGIAETMNNPAIALTITSSVGLFLVTLIVLIIKDLRLSTKVAADTNKDIQCH